MSDPQETTRRPYAGRRIAFATMHGKEAAVSAAARDLLGAEIVVPEGIDTDRLGTFSGEVARIGTVEETARAKARMGMAAAGLDLGLASEGSYGPHPQIPFLAAGQEVMVLVDDTRGIVLCETLTDPAPRYDHATLALGEDAAPFLSRIGFPDHAVVVRPNTGGMAFKGLRDAGKVVEAIARAAGDSRDGRAFVQTDMRAHMNPTRMALLSRLAQRLFARAATPCPACSTPGFGRVGLERGLPCAWCAAPTDLVRAELFGCTLCNWKETRPRGDGLSEADPGTCPACNP